MNPKTYQQIFDLIQAQLKQGNSREADFVEGSFNSILTGAFSLAYNELQSYAMDQFAKTWFQNQQTSGQDLENLAVDHFYEGAARPGQTQAQGAVTITRKSGNTDQIDIPLNTEFSVGDKKFLSYKALTILPAKDSGVLFLRAEQGGPGGNIPSASEWTTSIAEVDVANSVAFQGGANTLNDDQYREFIKQFILSLEIGTRRGIENAVKLIPGVSDARLVRILSDVGELDSTGALKANPAKFKTVQLKIYVAGAGGSSNAALLALAEEAISQRLSAGENIEVLSAVPKTINMTLNLVFASSADALALSQKPDEIKAAFAQKINEIGIGEDLDVSAFPATVLSAYGWTNHFTTSTITLPAADINLMQSEKAVAGNITML